METEIVHYGWVLSKLIDSLKAGIKYPDLCQSPTNQSPTNQAPTNQAPATIAAETVSHTHNV